MAPLKWHLRVLGVLEMGVCAFAVVSLATGLSPLVEHWLFGIVAGVGIYDGWRRATCAS